MRIGVVFPQLDLGGDVDAVRAYGQGVERLGFSHVLAYDHVLGSDPEVHVPWLGPYDIDTTFHEPLVMFGYLAGVTRLELVTGILILPQRPTALVAKQAAEVDLLTGGRFRLGVGIGWNKVEYDALGKDFTNRGRRLDEQVGLLRRLWTERSVTMDGRFEQVTGAGLSPAPIQRPIPVWCGERPNRPTAGSVGSPTAGSRWSRRGTRSTRPAASSAPRPPRPGVTSRGSAWRVACSGSPRILTGSFARSIDGAVRGPRTSGSTPCGSASVASTVTCPHWKRQPDCSSSRPPDGSIACTAGDEAMFELSLAVVSGGGGRGRCTRWWSTARRPTGGRPSG